jgi:hypothetical protein
MTNIQTFTNSEHFNKHCTTDQLIELLYHTAHNGLCFPYEPQLRVLQYSINGFFAKDKSALEDFFVKIVNDTTFKYSNFSQIELYSYLLSNGQRMALTRQARTDFTKEFSEIAVVLNAYLSRNIITNIVRDIEERQKAPAKRKTTRIPWASPDNSSSLVEAVKYDPKTQYLWIRFVAGDVYGYSDVPEYRYNKFLRSASPGSYYNSYIKGVYRSELVA